MFIEKLKSHQSIVDMIKSLLSPMISSLTYLTIHNTYLYLLMKEIFHIAIWYVFVKLMDQITNYSFCWLY